MSGSPSVIRRPFFEKSNVELISSLRANIAAHRSARVSTSDSASTSAPEYQSWTRQSGSVLYVPFHTASLLNEPREAYDVTVKLFYLPNAPTDGRCAQTREAVDLVLKELSVPSIDLLIVSFPGISSDADDDDEGQDEDEDEKKEEEEEDPDSDHARSSSASTSDNQDGSCMDAGIPPESIESMVATWRTLEQLHAEGLVSKLGIAELGAVRLKKFLEHSMVKPSVNQINVRDCCVVPRPLILLAKEQQIELLTHSDCTNILPPGAVRQILGSGAEGAGVLAGPGQANALQGDAEPQWAVKYTAVVKDRGVVESKGYFAGVELRTP